MNVTPADVANWAASANAKVRRAKEYRPCGGTGRVAHPTDLRRCPHGCEPIAWRDYCRECGEPTISYWNDDD